MIKAPGIEALGSSVYNRPFAPIDLSAGLKDVMQRVHIWVSGRVQGVFYRQSAVQEATRLGLSGWVRNHVDGRVEGVAEGSPEAVGAWLAWCNRGPAAARVESVLVKDEQPAGERGFKVIED
jgi:acylphosphatase